VKFKDLLVSINFPGTHPCLTFYSLAVSLRTTRFNIQQILHGTSFALSFLYGSQNRQRLLLNTALSGCNIKSKRIPSIFNDESTGSFICLAYSTFLCFLTSSMPVSGSTVLYTITPQSGIDHDFVSVVEILLKVSPHSFLHHTYVYVTCSKVNARSSRTSSDVTI
jgi:hypothetical protein